MSKWARIENGVVAETTDIDPAGRFHPSLVWVECPDSVDQNFGYDGGKFSEPAPAPEITLENITQSIDVDQLAPEELAALENLTSIINNNPEALNTAIQGESA